MVELHAASKWKNLGREVMEAEKPYKQIVSRFLKDRPISLFGVWQTKKFVVKLNEDGSLPANKYGCFSLYNG